MLAMEFVRGPSIREILGGGMEDDLGEEEEEGEIESEAEIEREGIVKELFARGLRIRALPISLVFELRRCVAGLMR